MKGSDHGLWLRRFDGTWHDWRKLGRGIWPFGFRDVQAAQPVNSPSWFANDMTARYCLVDGTPSQLSTIEALSVDGGAPRSWNGIDFGGDYMTGGFFYWKGKNYVAQWTEPSGIWANIVSVP